MKHSGSILVVDDNQDILIALKMLLKQHFQHVYICAQPEQIPELIQQYEFDLVLLDMNFTQDSISGQEGFDWLQRIISLDPSIAVVMMTAYGEIQLAVEAIKAGAVDFIIKPWQNQTLLASITAALTHAKDKRQLQHISQKTNQLQQTLAHSLQPFLGQTAIMQQVFTTIEQVAKTDANVLILGESGTGKELAAKAIHQASLRAQSAFISKDMGTISESLFESELFGHKKGAFTDAKENRVGLFELAQGGSLFLDELANLPLSQQAKLLAVLQNRQITPVGSSKTIAIDIRLICATNDNLQQAVSDGRFRQDLLYRINTVIIELPPLRQRQADIPLLSQYYLQHFNQKYKRQLQLQSQHIKQLCQYSWPGNVRELAHTIERAVILNDATQLQLGSLLPQNNSNTSHNNGNSQSFNLEQLERQSIQAALNHYQGNVSQAAKALGLTRGAMYRRLEKYDL